MIRVRVLSTASLHTFTPARSMQEMYTLQDRRGSTLCLRPENTAGLARAFGSSGLSQVHELPQRFYYHGPMFR